MNNIFIKRQQPKAFWLLFHNVLMADEVLGNLLLKLPDAVMSANLGTPAICFSTSVLLSSFMLSFILFTKPKQKSGAQQSNERREQDEHWDFGLMLPITKDVLMGEECCLCVFDHMLEYPLIL